MHTNNLKVPKCALIENLVALELEFQSKHSPVIGLADLQCENYFLDSKCVNS